MVSRSTCCVVGQTADGNATLVDRHGLTCPVLDDSRLKVSFAYDIDMVPSVFVARRERTPDSNGSKVSIGRSGRRSTPNSRRWPARHRRASTGLRCRRGGPVAARCRSIRGSPTACGRSGEQSAARAQDRDRAAGRRIRVHVRSGLHRRPAGGAADAGARHPHAVGHAARSAAGRRRRCRRTWAKRRSRRSRSTRCWPAASPSTCPVVIAAIEAVCTDAFNVHGVMATTMGASPVLVVNGPIRHRIGMNMKLGALGQGNRANATIGRAVRLAVRNVGGAKPGGTERSTLGNPMKIHHVLCRVGGAQPLDAAARGARLCADRFGRYGVCDVERTVADRRSDVAHGRRSSPAASACVWSRSTIRRRT